MRVLVIYADGCSVWMPDAQAQAMRDDDSPGAHHVTLGYDADPPVCVPPAAAPIVARPRRRRADFTPDDLALFVRDVRVMTYERAADKWGVSRTVAQQLMKDAGARKFPRPPEQPHV